MAHSKGKTGVFEYFLIVPFLSVYSFSSIPVLRGSIGVSLSGLKSVRLQVNSTVLKNSFVSTNSSKSSFIFVTCALNAVSSKATPS